MIKRERERKREHGIQRERERWWDLKREIDGGGGARSQEHYIIAGLESEGKDMSQWADCAWLSLSLSFWLSSRSLSHWSGSQASYAEVTSVGHVEMNVCAYSLI